MRIVKEWLLHASAKTFGIEGLAARIWHAWNTASDMLARPF
jgi:hemoglobin-like flavoprotein